MIKKLEGISMMLQSKKMETQHHEDFMAADRDILKTQMDLIPLFLNVYLNFLKDHLVHMILM